MSLPEAYATDAAIGCVVVSRSYRPGYSYEDVPEFATPEEAQAYTERPSIVAERLRFRTSDGAEFDAHGALEY
jgi:hypothetical protein